MVPVESNYEWTVIFIWEVYRSTPFERLFALSTATNSRGHSAKIAKHHCHLDLRPQTIFIIFRAYCRPWEQYVTTHNKLFWELFEQNSLYKDGLLHRIAISRFTWPFSNIWIKFSWKWIRCGRIWYVLYLVNYTANLSLLIFRFASCWAEPIFTQCLVFTFSFFF